MPQVVPNQLPLNLPSGPICVGRRLETNTGKISTVILFFVGQWRGVALEEVAIVSIK